MITRLIDVKLRPGNVEWLAGPGDQTWMCHVGRFLAESPEKSRKSRIAFCLFPVPSSL